MKYTAVKVPWHQFFGPIYSEIYQISRVGRAPLFNEVMLYHVKDYLWTFLLVCFLAAWKILLRIHWINWESNEPWNLSHSVEMFLLPILKLLFKFWIFYQRLIQRSIINIIKHMGIINYNGIPKNRISITRTNFQRPVRLSNHPLPPFWTVFSYIKTTPNIFNNSNFLGAVGLRLMEFLIPPIKLYNTLEESRHLLNIPV